MRITNQVYVLSGSDYAALYLELLGEIYGIQTDERLIGIKAHFFTVPDHTNGGPAFPFCQFRMRQWRNT
ncbi:MAG: hypothetical protein LBF87_08670 [Treponema sp.]|jgi:hypothetical protein|nr:hypothetical protein [Treponema sp.]